MKTAKRETRNLLRFKDWAARMTGPAGEKTMSNRKERRVEIKRSKLKQKRYGRPRPWGEQYEHKHPPKGEDDS